MRRHGHRTRCVVDGCSRSTSKVYDEWICPKHWALLTRAEKRVWARIRRRERLRPETLSPARYDRIWRSLKRRATVEDEPKMRARNERLTGGRRAVHRP